MKKYFFIPLILLTGLRGMGQPVKPSVKKGTVFQYTFHLHGQSATFELQVTELDDTLTLNWKVRGLAGGSYLVTPKALSDATHLNFAQPLPFTKNRLKDNETFLMISRSAFKSLTNSGEFVYDNTTYRVKNDVQSNTVLLNGKPLDVIHVTATDETTQFWILNNPDFPFICQIKDNPLGIDAVLNNMTQLPDHDSLSKPTL